MNEKSAYRYSDFNEYVERYDNWYERFPIAFISQSNAFEKIILKRGLGLEVGVGTGRFASKLNVPYGIDPAKQSLKLAYQRGVKVISATGEYLPFKDETFEYLLMVITISFLQNPEQALHEANRVLKEGGKIIIGMVDKNTFLGKLYREKKAKGYPFYSKATFFSPSEVIGSLEKANFENFETYQTILDLPEKLKNVQHCKKGYGEGAFVVICADKR